jgi:hypothetical protein
MDEPISPQARFAWVRKPDGRLVPFDADRISRDLFAAGEQIGKPDAFLARELTDSVLHFLNGEVAAPIPTTTQIADLVVKVVRELGQPELAVAFAEAQQSKNGDAARSTTPLVQQLAGWVETTPAPENLIWRTASSSLRDYSLQQVLTRDLAALQADGLLTLGGLEAPLELSGWVLSADAVDGLEVVEAIEAARSIAGEFLSLDGPEYVLARREANIDAARDFARAVKLGLRLMQLKAVVNLNCKEPPAHLGELAMGPLFESFQNAAQPTRLRQLADALLEQFLTEPGGWRVRVDWHLGRSDFEPGSENVLLRLARRGLEGAPLAFAFDRHRRMIHLGEGLDRHHPATLLHVRLNLPRLVEQAGADLDAVLFVKKLGSLARLALSAAKQKRDFLRRHAHARPMLGEGFLLDRARLVVVPVGVEAVAQLLLGRGLCSGGSAPEFARQIVQRLQSVLRADGQACVLETSVDSAPEWPAAATPAPGRGREFAIREAAGLTAWDGSATPKSQLRAASVMQAVVQSGTATVLLPEAALPAPEEIAELLHYAWKQTEVVRVRFLRLAGAELQPAVPWED